jgi:hypothetical protein
MPINFSSLGGGSSSGGGGISGSFVINTGDYSSDTAQLSREYEAGAYGILVSPTDSTLDIYLVALDGSFAGYSNIGTITATTAFDKVVVLGSTSNTSLSFSFNGESQTATTKGAATNAGAYLISVVTSSLPSVNDTTIVNGGNFADDVEVTFIGQSEVETAAKTVVRSSSTELITTRPDAFSPDDSPYTVKVVNPGIPVPAGTNAHLLSNSVTAGTNPVWTTPATVYYEAAGAVSITLLATDTEASDIDYSVVSGTLPDGLVLDGETGVISGTTSGAESDVSAVTIRAIDAGGNFLDKAFNFTANLVPTWTTATGAIPDAIPDAPYSFQLVASGGAAGGALTYTLQSGALLAGHSLSSAGLISGTSTEDADSTDTFTIRVTDEGGLFVDRSFSIIVQLPDAFNINSFSNSGITMSRGLEYNQANSRLYVSTNQGDPLAVNLYTVNQSTGQIGSNVQSISITGNATSKRDIAFTSDGTLAYVLGYSSQTINSYYSSSGNFDWSTPTNSISVTDLNLGQGGWNAAMVDDEQVLMPTNKTLKILTVATNQVTTITLPNYSPENSNSIAYDPLRKEVYIGSYNQSTLVKYSYNKSTKTLTHISDTGTSFAGIQSLAIGGDNSNILYIGDNVVYYTSR